MIATVGLLAAAIVATGLLISAHDAVLRPALRRMAARNLRRRVGESILVGLGCSLGTATIVASLLVGSSFHASVRDGARTDLGPIDEVVTLRTPGDVAPALAALGTPSAAWGVDGLLGVVTGTASISAAPAQPTRTDEPAVTKPDSRVAEVDMSVARSFGTDVRATGLASIRSTPALGEVVINRSTAAHLRVAVGGHVTLHAYGAARQLRVVAVVPHIGLAGYADAFVAPGTLQAMSSSGQGVMGQPPEGQLLVSNVGGVFGGAAKTSQVAATLRTRLRGVPGTDVSAVKRDLLRVADEQGNSMGQVFVGVGSFSVLAGVLLLINLVVMLAEERRRELGIARAVGLRRLQVSRLFALEGTVYCAASALLGALLGTVVGWMIVGAARAALGDVDFSLRLATPPEVVAIGAGIGFGVSVTTVWLASFRIAALPIVRALRDLPPAPRHGHHVRTAGPGAAALAGGIGLAGWGVVAGNPLAALVGPPLALVGALPLLRPAVGRRLAVGVLSGAALAWCGGVFAFIPSLGDRVPVPVFVVQGVLLVGFAVSLATAADHLWVGLVEKLSRAGRGLAARIGLAYPLARLGRTAMLLATYALVVFTLSFIAIYGHIFGGQAAEFTEQVQAGTDLRVQSNPASPLSAARLDALPGVAYAAPLWTSAPQFTADSAREPTTWVMTGFDSSLLRYGTPALAHRASRYGTDRAVFEAVAASRDLVVVGDQFLVTADRGQPGSAHVEVGDLVAARNPTTGVVRRLRVVGVLAHDLAGSGAFASQTTVRNLMGERAVQNVFYVKVDQGRSAAAVADTIETTFVDSGAQARTFRSLVDESISTQLGFFRLMEGYLLLGLVIGTAAVGMVMVRAVRERRRQIGMLRAMGFAASTVRRAFLIEAGFIASQGALMGIALGLVISWQMLTHSAALGGEPLPYSVPWVTLVALGAVPFAASLAAVFVPATQAARVDPAVALYRSD